MRIICIILNAALALVTFRALQSATTLYREYSSLNKFGVSLSQLNKWELPYVISFVIYAAALGFSIYFFVQKKIIFSAIISTVMIVVYFMCPYLGFAWLR